MFFEYPKNFRSKQVAPGWLVHFIIGEHMSLSRHSIDPKSVAAMHTHVNEQMGMILDGEFEMTIGNETRRLKRGDTYRVPPNVVHGGVTHERSTSILEAFSPPRDYDKL